MRDFSKLCAETVEKCAHTEMKRPLAVWSAAFGLKIDLENERYSAPVPLTLAAPHFAVESKTRFHIKQVSDRIPRA